MSKTEKRNKLIIKIYNYLSVIVFATFVLIPVVMAEEDPIAVVNNLSDFIFSITKVVGGIIVGYSVVQIGLSFTSHDPSQRANGFLFFVGGVIIMFSKKILDIIAG